MRFHGKALPHRRPINVNHFQIFSWSIKPSNLSGFSVFYPQLDMELRPKWFNLCNGFVIFFVIHMHAAQSETGIVTGKDPERKIEQLTRA